jgi:hypothetical protein
VGFVQDLPPVAGGEQEQVVVLKVAEVELALKTPQVAPLLNKTLRIVFH